MEYTDDLGKLTILKNGKETECDVLFTFECEELGKNYVGYTDNSIGSNNRKNIYVSSYDPVIGLNELEDITTEAEMNMVLDVLRQIDGDKGSEYNEHRRV